MQRPFTSFPNGWPGIGLALLRCSLVFELVGRTLDRFFLSSSEPAVIHPADWLALLIAAALCLGVLTPIAVIASGILIVAALPAPVVRCCLFGNWEIVRVLVLVISIALVGPGAYSVDGRLFGRREIIVRRIPLSGDDQ